MGKREKRERNRANRLAAEAQRKAERRDRRRREILAQRCPACGSGEVACLLYGLPDLAALREEIDSDLVVLAGCSFAASDPLWVCRRCRHNWGTLAEVLGA